VKRLLASPTLTDEELDNAVRAPQRRRQRAHPDGGGTHENFLAAPMRYDELVAEREKRKGRA